LQGGTSTPQQLVVVCGNNKKVKADLEAKAASHHWGKGVDVVVKGFIGNMEDYMSARLHCYQGIKNTGLCF